MTTPNALDAYAATMSDEQIMDALVHLERLLESLHGTMRDLANQNRAADALKIRDEAQAHRMVYVALIDRIEARYPWLIAEVEAWCNNDADERTYVAVLTDALTREYVLA